MISRIALFLVVAFSVLQTPCLAQTWYNAPHDLAVDPSTINATGVHLTAGERVILLAKGLYSPWDEGADRWHSWIGPAGNYLDAVPSGSQPLPGYPGGCLIGRIGTGDWFWLGEFLSFFADESGELQLAVNDGTTFDNRGSLMVHVWRPDVPGTAAPAVASGSLANVRSPMPNPFRSTTRLEFSLQEATDATIRIFDAGGRRILERPLGALGAGTHEFRWDGRDDAGQPTASGVYFYQLETSGGRMSSERMVQVR